MERFEPRIIAFCCRWCSYAGADLAGVSRFQYPPNVRIIKTMCSGRVSQAMILRAFEKGADGVLVSGCHIGDCHYISGNEKCKQAVAMTKDLLEILGIDRERLRLEWVSSAEGKRFAEIVAEFTNQIREKGKLRQAVAVSRQAAG